MFPSVFKFSTHLFQNGNIARSFRSQLGYHCEKFFFLLRKTNFPLENASRISEWQNIFPSGFLQVCNIFLPEHQNSLKFLRLPF